MTADELLKQVEEEIEKIKDSAEEFDERIALQFHDDGLTTDDRAVAALQRPERFRGEHAVACAWLKNHAEEIFTKI